MYRLAGFGLSVRGTYRLQGQPRMRQAPRNRRISTRWSHSLHRTSLSPPHKKQVLTVRH